MSACRSCGAEAREERWRVERRNGAGLYAFELVGWRCETCCDTWADAAQREANEQAYRAAPRVRWEAD